MRHLSLLAVAILLTNLPVCAKETPNIDVKTCAQNMTVFLDENNVEREYTVVKVIDATRLNSGGLVNLKFGKDPMTKLKRTACKLGADAVILLGTASGNSRRVDSTQGALIKWKSDQNETSGEEPPGK